MTPSMYALNSDEKKNQWIWKKKEQHSKTEDRRLTKAVQYYRIQGKIYSKGSNGQ